MKRVTLPIRSPPARPHISHSSISTFQACPLRYAFRYVLQLPEETISSSLAVGQALHAGLEHHFSQLLAGNAAPVLDDLLGVFWDAWGNQLEARRIMFGAGEDLNSIGKLVDRLFRSFMVSDFAQPKGTIIGVEEEVRSQVIEGVPEVLARIDLLTDGGNELVVTDFKTSRSSWSHEQVLSSASQLLLYHEAVKPLADGKPIRLRFAVLTKTKVPSLVLHDVPVDQRKIERVKAVVKRVWRAIQQGHFYPNPSMLNCSTCPYRRPCDRWSG